MQNIFNSNYHIYASILRDNLASIVKINYSLNWTYKQQNSPNKYGYRTTLFIFGYFIGLYIYTRIQFFKWLFDYVNNFEHSIVTRDEKQNLKHNIECDIKSDSNTIRVDLSKRVGLGYGPKFF